HRLGLAGLVIDGLPASLRRRPGLHRCHYQGQRQTCHYTPLHHQLLSTNGPTAGGRHSTAGPAATKPPARPAWTRPGKMRMIRPRNASVAQLDRVLPSEGNTHRVEKGDS